MKPVVFHFDVISPFAYLAFERLPQELAGCHYLVEYRPVLLGPMLRHWGQKGPAEIAPKREWTFRHVAWLAQRHGIEFHAPAPHPFNPLALQRLCLACGEAGELPNRYVVEAVMRHVWCGGGADPNDPARLAALTQRLAPRRDPAGADVKDELRTLTDAAIARGVFGVPACEVDGALFWGLDALPMLRDALLQEGAGAAGPAPR
jgi:2-hydroxychromene-2-carboxylate isomerase